MWHFLAEKNPSLVTKMANAKLVEERKTILKHFENNLSRNISEPKWQDFFYDNQWIFGYGLQYKFQGILQKEFHASNTNINGSGAVISDFLLADSRFTTFVELKRPDTPLYKGVGNRSNAWSLSNELLYAVSQILEQKASGQIKMEKEELYDDCGNVITQRPIDPKVILIIGMWNEIENDNSQTQRIKERTFELFRRDSRNIDIITYDELYDRAKFIVESLSSDQE